LQIQYFVSWPLIVDQEHLVRRDRTLTAICGISQYIYLTQKERRGYDFDEDLVGFDPYSRCLTMTACRVPRIVAGEKVNGLLARERLVHVQPENLS
jgi:hypothetical protein